MALLIISLTLPCTLSEKTKPRTPAASCSRNTMVGQRESVCRRQMFSQRDHLMQPQKVSRNLRMPTRISRMARSTARQASAASGGVAVCLLWCWLNGVPGVGGALPELSSSPGGGLFSVAKGYREQYCPPTGRTRRAQKGLWPLIWGTNNLRAFIPRLERGGTIFTPEKN